MKSTKVRRIIMTDTGGINIRLLIGSGLAGLLLLSALPGCTDDPAGDENPVGVGTEDPTVPENLPTLALVQAWEQEDSVAVDLVYSPGQDAVGPRMMELYLQAAAGLKYASSEPLAAVEAAGKQLVVQAEDDGMVRTVIFATNNVDRLQAGPLARFIFLRQEGVRRIELLDRHPIFAPADADTGLTLSEPLVIGGP
jgi:hypothetical protein